MADSRFHCPQRDRARRCPAPHFPVSYGYVASTHQSPVVMLRLVAEGPRL